MKVGKVDYNIECILPDSFYPYYRAYVNGLTSFLGNTRKQAYDCARRSIIRAQNPKNVLKWCESNLEKDGENFIAYKRIGSTHYAPPKRWKIKPGSFLFEAKLDYSIARNCGPGVNVATKNWVKYQYQQSTIWRVKIYRTDILKGDVIVPLGTDGKFRCRRIRLIEDIGKYI